MQSETSSFTPDSHFSSNNKFPLFSISNYDQVRLKRVGQNLISTLTLLQEPCVQSTYPLTFEQIDHGYGYVLYSTTIKSSGTNLTANNIRDFGYVFVNNVYQVKLVANSV